MNTYKGYALNTSDSNKPTVHIFYARGAKYGDAWRAATAALANRPVKGNEAAGVPKLFSDADCKVDAKLGHGDHIVCAKVIDTKERNKKVDKVALQGILTGNGTAEEKLKAAMAALGNR